VTDLHIFFVDRNSI